MIDPLCGKRYPQPAHASQPDLGSPVPFDAALWSCRSSLPRTFQSETSKELKAVRWGLAKPFWTSAGLTEGSFVFLVGDVICILDHLFTNSRVLISVWLKLVERWVSFSTWREDLDTTNWCYKGLGKAECGKHRQSASTTYRALVLTCSRESAVRLQCMKAGKCVLIMLPNFWERNLGMNQCF